ncbi:unnamed protein product, partial [Gongylonema pulchrum]|uniref:AAA_5 domain-containing protein n=1 Tax=Gongylonema pulchrum TaxID=637853 RepID=A0A183EQH7_9BILA
MGCISSVLFEPNIEKVLSPMEKGTQIALFSLAICSHYLNFLQEDSGGSHETDLKQNAHEIPSCFGECEMDLVDLTFQNAFVETCYEYVLLHLAQSIASSTDNILIVGDHSTSKTTILHILAQKLLRSRWAVYSECLCCTDWKGKSLENIEKVLTAAAVRLRQRFPSVLFLDNLNFFSR